MTATALKDARDLAGRPFTQERLNAASAAYDKARAKLNRFLFSHCRCSQEQREQVGCDCEAENLTDADYQAIRRETAAIMPQSTPLAVFDFGPDFARSGVTERFGYRAVRDELFGAAPVAFNVAGRKAWDEAKARAEAGVDAASDALELATYDPSRSF